LPTQYGESLVLRVLDRSIVNLDLEALGMPDYIYNFLLEMIERPERHFHRYRTDWLRKNDHALLLFAQDQHNRFEADHCGGASRIRLGRYRSGARERSDRLNLCSRIATLSAPDPDRIMVGETRDLETAQIAIQASLTGIWFLPRCTQTMRRARLRV